ncbi:unnamed protein product [Citrullus colocynthis]|uniref:Secreted protein n=1 Tax=Citrullus colocynthis TaxID=252529 RepID=A0ABP0Z5E8_9ROSI
MAWMVVVGVNVALLTKVSPEVMLVGLTLCATRGFDGVMCQTATRGDVSSELSVVSWIRQWCCWIAIFVDGCRGL